MIGDWLMWELRLYMRYPALVEIAACMVLIVIVIVICAIANERRKRRS